MRHIQQPKYSKLCGQYCVAMITGLATAKIISEGFLNHKRGTTTKQVREALNRFGYNTSPRLVRCKPCTDLPNLCILHLKHIPGRGGHWVVYNKGRIYDPAYPFIYNHESDKDFWETSGFKMKLVSYLEIF